MLRKNIVIKRLIIKLEKYCASIKYRVLIVEGTRMNPKAASFSEIFCFIMEKCDKEKMYRSLKLYVTQYLDYCFANKLANVV